MSPRPRRAFTLLEVVIAMAILAVGLTVLVSSQANAVVMAAETDNIRVGTLIAQEKMNEALLRVEADGFIEGQDVEEEGDFSDFGSEDFRGTEGLDLELGDRLAEFKWAYTIRQIEFDVPPDVGGAMDMLGATGMWGGAENEATQDVNPTSAMEGMGQDMLAQFITPEAMTQQLSPLLREVRVRVWWGDNEDGTDQVELLTHVRNPDPSGGTSPPPEEQ